MAKGKLTISKTSKVKTKSKPKVKVNPKSKAKPVRDTAAEALELAEGCQKELRNIVGRDKNLYLAFVNDDFGFLIKKKQVNVNKVVNPDSMQPYEKNENQTFFDCFIVEWGNDKAKHQVFGKLIDLGINSYKIISPMVLDYVVREA